MHRYLIAPAAGLLVLFLLIFSACQSSSPAKSITLTILHTNDVHSALDNGARLTTAINQVREDAGKENLLLLDAGDMLTGTLYNTLFKGEAEAWFMNRDGYDAMALGNHEFDRGPDGLAEFIKSLKFPVVGSNLTVSGSSPLKDLIKPYLVFEKSGSRFGLIGLTNRLTPEISSPGSLVAFSSEFEAAQNTLRELNQKGINKIIVLSNMGWEEDLKLAARMEGIDVIIGGHTHTLADPYPAVIKRGETNTLVVQAGEMGKYLGKLQISFDAAGNVQDWSGSQLIKIDENLAEDPAGVEQLAKYKPSISVFTQHIIGQTTVGLDGDRSRNRSQETNLGNLIADSMLHKASRVQAALALTTGGGIRASIPAGDISLGNIMEVLPFNNFLVTLDITGEQLRQALENGVSQVKEGNGRFPQIAGLRFTWAPEAAGGQRIKSIEIKNAAGYQTLDLSALYRVVTTSYLAGGGDGYTVFKDGANLITLGDMDFDVLAEYITSHSPVSPAVEGRIRTVAP